MRVGSMKRAMIAGVFLTFMAAGFVPAAEIITEEDILQEVIEVEDLVRVADNAIFLFDGSTSMREPYRDTGMSKYEAVLNEFKVRNSYMPQIGHKFGLYLFTPWEEIYPMQEYDRDKFAAALDSMKDKPKGKTLLRTGLRKVQEILPTLSGKTALFVFTDGSYANDDSEVRRPVETAKKMIEAHDLCIYVISTASERLNMEMVNNIAGLNSCSRVIPLGDFLNRAEYNSGALFTVKKSVEVITITEQRIVGIVADDVTFEFNKADVRQNFTAELKEVGGFLKENPEAYVLLQGYADNIGSQEYNMGLSHRRAKRVADYLINNLGIDESRIVMQWYGYANPIASNDTEEGRALNRRVEMAIGGM